MSLLAIKTVAAHESPSDMIAKAHRLLSSNRGRVPENAVSEGWRNSRGFTLVELIGTCLLMGILFSMTVPMLLVVARERRSTEQRQFALQRASNLLERTAQREWSELQPGEISLEDVDGDLRQVLPDLEQKLLIHQVAGESDAIQVVASLRWRNAAGEYVAPIRLSHLAVPDERGALMKLTSWTLPSQVNGKPGKSIEASEAIAGRLGRDRLFPSIGDNAARRLRSSAGECVSRRGYTLVEMVVVISMLTMIISLAGMTFHLLLRTDKAVLQASVTERTISRLAILFREDVHRAETGVIDTQEEQTPQRLSLEVPGRDPVRYVVTEAGIVRLTLEHGAVIARDDFVLPECEVFPDGRQHGRRRFTNPRNRTTCSLAGREAARTGPATSIEDRGLPASSRSWANCTTNSTIRPRRRT